MTQWFEYFAALIRTHEGTVPPFLGAYVNYGKSHIYYILSHMIHFHSCLRVWSI